MRVGTRSVLFGAHALWLHPFFVAAAWSRLYGFPFDVRLWASFWLHDIGYIGCRDMDGADGERHVGLGGRITEMLFGREWGDLPPALAPLGEDPWWRTVAAGCGRQARIRDDPWWLYIPMTSATGELEEYMAVSQQRQAGDDFFTAAERESLASGDRRRWLAALQAYTRRWVGQHVQAPGIASLTQTSN